MRKIVITGGAGFAGLPHMIDRFCERFPSATIIVFDRMTYASDVRNLTRHILSDRIRLIVADVADMDSCLRIVEDASLVVHAAAESHVDNSFGNSREFTRTNVLGTHCLLEACRIHKVPRFVHISTDEVYGEVPEGSADEQSALTDPTDPCILASKGGRGNDYPWLHSFLFHARGGCAGQQSVWHSSISGEDRSAVHHHQPHVARSKASIARRRPEARRHYLSARDFADAVVYLAERGKIGETYNVGTHEEYTNTEVAGLIARAFARDPEQVIEFVADLGRLTIAATASPRTRSAGWVGCRAARWRQRISRAWSTGYEDNLQRYAAHLDIPPNAVASRGFLLPEQAA